MQSGAASDPVRRTIPCCQAFKGKQNPMISSQKAILSSFATICLLLVGSQAFAEVIASCSDPKGYAQYHFHSAVPKKQSGLQKDAISGGLTTLRRLDNGEYDILIVDARSQVISFRQDGGKIMLLRRGASDATFLVVFPGMAIELYTFYVDADGGKRFDILQSKGGDGMPVHKSALMSGLCSEINLRLVN